MKVYAYLALFGAVIGLLWGAFHYGQLSERSKAHKAVIAYQKREAKLLDELEKSRSKREIVYRDRIKTVREAKGQCLDSVIEPKSIRDSLFNDLPPS